MSNRLGSGLSRLAILVVFGFTIYTSIPHTSAADEAVGTFSIVAFDSTTGEVGVAVQSRVFGVGQRVAWVKAGAGAIATQANSNETFGPRGLKLLGDGLSAREVLDWLLAHDDGRDNRQPDKVSTVTTRMVEGSFACSRGATRFI